ncbi:MAG: hypothetical protein HEQ38_17865 [Gemmatimonas sp.]|uniref:hypothetical protein n=1 Tax=Gemmatimonas sp. TaxID=1962908 RepID=UPI0031C85AA5|nr:hypothetical protein [Gemmatimonas sp.]
MSDDRLRSWHRARFTVSALAAITLLAACRARAGGASPSGAPLLTRLAPERVDISGGAVVELTVFGTGFDSLNTVHLGRLVVPAVRRLNDSTMRFAVPTDDRFLLNRGGAPLAPLTGGMYDLRIESTKGMSNTLRVMLVNSREAR